MELERIRKFSNKKVLLILDNHFRYTTTLPPIINEQFSILDKFDNKIDLKCKFISMVKELEI